MDWVTGKKAQQPAPVKVVTEVTPDPAATAEQETKNGDQKVVVEVQEAPEESTKDEEMGLPKTGV